MKQFLSFVAKEFHHIFRDRITMLILLVMPVVLLVLFGFAITTEVKNVNFGVIDNSKDDMTRSITERMAKSNYFSFRRNLSSPKEADEAFRKGEVSMAIVFPDGFADRLIHEHNAKIQILADGTEPNQASVAVVYAQQILASWISEKSESMNTGASMSITPQVRMLYNPQQRGEFLFVPGVIGMLLLLLNAMMSSVAIVKEKETGTLEMLLASPLPPIYIILAKAVPYFCLSAINTATILLMSNFVLDIPVSQNLFLIVMFTLLYIFMSLALGLLVSTIASSQLVAMLVSAVIFMMPTMLLSGLMFPIESMPKWLQYVSAVMPARWFIEAMRKLMIQGVDFIYVTKEFIILSGMTILFIVVSLKKFKIRLE